LAKRRLLAFVLAVTCLPALANRVFATPVLTGVGSAPGDWTPAYFYEGAPLIGPASGPGTFDAVQIEWVSGSQFQVPAMTGLTPGWSELYASPTIALATGSEVSALNLTVNFEGSTPIPTVYDFQAYYNGGCVDDWRMFVDSSGNWSYVSWSKGNFLDPPPPELRLVNGVPVPEPVSMIFFGTGLVAVGGYVARRRMLNKA